MAKKSKSAAKSSAKATSSAKKPAAKPAKKVESARPLAKKVAAAKSALKAIFSSKPKPSAKSGATKPSVKAKAVEKSDPKLQVKATKPKSIKAAAAPESSVAKDKTKKGKLEKLAPSTVKVGKGPLKELSKKEKPQILRKKQDEDDDFGFEADDMSDEIPSDLAAELADVEVGDDLDDEAKPSSQLFSKMSQVAEPVAEGKKKKSEKDPFAAIEKMTNPKEKWEAVFQKSKTIPTVPFKMTGVFEPRTGILHKTFGWGFVMSVVNDRLEVLFKDGVRFLISNYKP